MPQRVKPVSPPMRAFMPSHRSQRHRISGISRGSRPIWRHQPQLRLDCSAAISPFSRSTTSTPRSASSRAVETPAMPPPMTQTAACLGSVGIGMDGVMGHGGYLARRACRSPPSGARMGLAVLLQQMGAVHFGIDLGGREAGMAEQLLDDAQVGAIGQQMRGEGMAQRMRCRRVGQAQRAAQPRDESWMLRALSGPPSRRGTSAARGQRERAELEVARHRVARRGSSGTMRVLPPLPVMVSSGSPACARGEPQGLRNAKPAAIEQRQHRRSRASTQAGVSSAASASAFATRGLAGESGFGTECGSFGERRAERAALRNSPLLLGIAIEGAEAGSCRASVRLSAPSFAPPARKARKSETVSSARSRAGRFAEMLCHELRELPEVPRIGLERPRRHAPLGGEALQATPCAA